LDRLGRSIINLADLLERFHQQKVELRSLTEGIDTRAAAGRMIYGVLSSLASYGREVTIERVKAGMSAAAKRGIHVGRMRGLTTGQVDHAKELRHQGKSLGEIAAVFRVSRSTVHRSPNR
jgi:putative DNA-invertase from lambdoid prophage Rac